MRLKIVLAAGMAVMIAASGKARADDQSDLKAQVEASQKQIEAVKAQLDKVTAVDLDDVVHRDAANTQRSEDLDHELIARRRGHVRRRIEPVGELLGPCLSDVKPLLRTLLLGFVGFHKSIALESLQRRVHLADVERPHFAGARLELLLELEAVLRAFTEEGENGVPDTHCAARSLIILSMVQART